MKKTLFTCFAVSITIGTAAAGSIGLVVDRSVEELGVESRAAWQLATNLGAARMVHVSKEGSFHDGGGQALALEGFSVVWFHQGDSAEANAPAYSAEAVATMRRYVAEGHGLLLSGAALGLVEQLGLENFGTRRNGPGRGVFAAGLIPVQAKHPVFEGLFGTTVGEEKQFLLNDTGHAAFSDFHGTGGPAGGMLLARANSGTENPLVEYALGKGRVIVLGWRAPHYAHANNPHRVNLERLTSNLLGYLARSSLWQTVAVWPSAAAKKAVEPGVSKARCEALEAAIRDLTGEFGERYPKGQDYLKELARIREAHERIGGENEARVAELGELTRRFQQLKTEALLDNPLLDFDQLLFVERHGANLGLPANWESNSSLKKDGFSNRLRTLSPVRPGGQVNTVFEPSGNRFIGDIDLHWNGKRMLFSMPGANGRWQVFELALGEKEPREIPLITEPDVDNYDACYLPDGRIVFTSTATFVGVPCVYGASHVANLYIRERDGSIRQLTVDQEHNWCPTVLNNGRLLYLRWEYTDLPHSNSRRLFHMNPDGTGQAEFLSGSSYFPNSFFYARPIPDHPTMVVGIATGHHGNARSGRLLIMDPARGREESEGVVREIPGRGKEVKPIIRDNLADGVWPQFLHPFPLSEKYFLVSARLRPDLPWGIYLVDVFDNFVLLAEKAGYALFEPVPVKRGVVPPVVADRIDRNKKDALVYVADIYQGGGLRGIPRGTVKNLRLIRYHFSYRGMGGLLGSIGMDGPWDIKQVLGTVPVDADGSAFFRVPAYTPITVQPLDEEGKALQLMRSWFTAMPGEVVSCVGCHERQNTAANNYAAAAKNRTPSDITPWRGPARGFSFAREVQPALDRHCTRCHNGAPWTKSSNGAMAGVGSNQMIPDLRGDVMLTNWTTGFDGRVAAGVGGKFSVAYAELHRFVRRPGIESDIHMLAPMEFHADSAELVQLLRKGHHDVQLDAEAWDRLITWIDLNAPYHGTWREMVGEQEVAHVASRARAMRQQFTGLSEDLECIPPKRDARVLVTTQRATGAWATGLGATDAKLSLPDCSFGEEEAQRRQSSDGPWQQTIGLGGGVSLELVRIPAGEFLMGSADGAADERPVSRVRVDRAFWIGRCEVSNEQFARFDPTHDSHVESMHAYQFGIHGYAVNEPQQPVVRVSWNEAAAFCQWLSERTGRRFDLPTEAQWEYACRAGAGTAFSFGGIGDDFSKEANLGDMKLSEFALETYIQVRLISNPNPFDDWVPHDRRFNDGAFVSAPVGSFRPNAWGLHDMHGNVWEWTRSQLRSYPYVETDGRNESGGSSRVVRGGSWYDRPHRCTSSYRLVYAPYQPVFNVGFRIVMEEHMDRAAQQSLRR